MVILKGNGDLYVEYCEILKRILWTLHDTETYVPSRDDNRLIGQSTVICTGRQIGDCDHWSTDWRL